MLFSEKRENSVKISCCYCFLLAFVIFLLYCPGLEYPFMEQYDDAVFVTNNPRLFFTFENLRYYFTKPFQDLYTPLPMVSLMLDHALFGFSPIGYHIHNILLHILCSVFFFFILRKFKIRHSLALFGAFLWALNPQKIESVIWITERKDVLSGFFAVVSFYLFMLSVEKKKVPVWSTFFGILALLSKPSTVPLPGVMAVYLFCVWGKRHLFKEYVKILFLPTVAFFSVILWSSFVTAQTFPGFFENRFPLWLHNMFWYPLTSIFPVVHPLHPLYLDNWKQFIPVYVAGTLTALFLVFWGRKIGLSRNKIIGFFLVTGGLVFPVLGIVVYTYFDYADRYNYLVSMAVWAFLIYLFEKTWRRYPKSGVWIRPVLIFGIVIYFAFSWIYLPYWEKCEYLFARCLMDTGPSNKMLYNNGAVAAYATENHVLLLKIAEKLLKDHKAYKDSEIQYFTGLAYWLHAAVLRKDYAVALPYYQELKSRYKSSGGLRKNYWAFFFHNMAVIAAQNGRYAEAEVFLQHFFHLQKRDIPVPSIYYNALALRAQMKNDFMQLRTILKVMKKSDPDLSLFTPLVSKELYWKGR